jgi:hypothetical protein
VDVRECRVHVGHAAERVRAEDDVEAVVARGPQRLLEIPRAQVQCVRREPLYRISNVMVESRCFPSSPLPTQCAPKALSFNFCFQHIFKEVKGE